MTSVWLAGFLWLANISLISASASLLGVGGNAGASGGVSLKGASFNLDIPASGLTRIHGTGLKVELDTLEIATSRGVLKYTGNSVEYIKNSMRWVQIFSESVVGLTHNSQPVVHILAPDDTPQYTFKMVRTVHIL